MNRLALLLLALTMTMACASGRELGKTAEEACSLYRTVKPQVESYRAWAVEHWDTIPEDQKLVLIRLDGYLPELDRAGQRICLAADLANTGWRDVEWDEVLAVVLKAATAAAQLERDGVF